MWYMQQKAQVYLDPLKSIQATYARAKHIEWKHMERHITKQNKHKQETAKQM